MHREPKYRTFKQKRDRKNGLKAFLIPYSKAEYLFLITSI